MTCAQTPEEAFVGACERIAFLSQRLAEAVALIEVINAHMEHDENHCDRNEFCDEEGAGSGCSWHGSKCPECTCPHGELMERVRKFVGTNEVRR